MIELRDATEDDLKLCSEHSLDEATKTYRQLLHVSGWAKTGICDGEIIGVGGVIVYWLGVGEAWIVLHENANKHKVQTFKAIQRMVNQAVLELNLRRIQAVCAMANLRGCDMIRALDFEWEGRMVKYLPNGQDAFLFARIKGDVK